MTDKEWQKVISACQKAGLQHRKLLRVAESEYIRRYGHDPSEVNDDWWIDTLHYCNGDSDVKKIKESAQLHCAD